MRKRDDMTFPHKEYVRRMGDLRKRMQQRLLDAVIISGKERANKLLFACLDHRLAALAIKLPITRITNRCTASKINTYAKRIGAAETSFFTSAPAAIAAKKTNANTKPSVSAPCILAVFWGNKEAGIMARKVIKT